MGRRVSNVPEIISSLLFWYKRKQRDLLWRKTRNPYRILVSEVMLQQTQVDRVIPKYKAFLRQFPNIKALANAKASDVIKAWKGLGYNRRALMLQRTAQMIRTEHGGRFPRDLETLKTLPGVGDYTARAILSFAYEQPIMMMDTNHRRFYQRVFFGMHNKTDKQLLARADELLENKQLHKSTYDWNQALMDFGSQICTTRVPKCQECPLKQWCRAYPKILTHTPNPVAPKTKTARIPFRQTDRYFRGRIIDNLRVDHRISLTKLEKSFPELPKERFQKIVRQLKTDGLIVQHGRSILLPD